MMSTPVTFSEVQRLLTAIQKYGFEPDDGEYLHVVDRFGEMFEMLDSTERELVTSLAEDLLVYHFRDYQSGLNRMLAGLNGSDVGECQDVVILPLSESNSHGAPKSNTTLLYHARHRARFVPAFSGKQVRSYEKVHLVSEKFSTRGKTFFLLLDDFIGTGSTAKLAVDEYRSKVEKAGDRYLVMALVAQERGLESLKADGIPYRVGLTRKRGISDSSKLQDARAALSTMLGIEKRMGVPHEYTHGYKGDEALVKMIRCPDNTFPIFWHTAGETPWPAPFPRF